MPMERPAKFGAFILKALPKGVQFPGSLVSNKKQALFKLILAEEVNGFLSVIPPKGPKSVEPDPIIIIRSNFYATKFPYFLKVLFHTIKKKKWH